MKRKAPLAILAALFLAGCSHDPVSTEQTANGITVELLFEHDGVKVYRFMDSGYYRYYSDARGAVEWEETHGYGKHSTSVRQSLPTVR